METGKIKPDRRGSWQQGCTAEVVYIGAAPGAACGETGSLDRIEAACSTPGHVASMHAHRHVEILTCVRSGTLLHVDSLGHEEKLSPGRLMLLDAGSLLHHEERTIGRDPVRGYHFYFRPDRGEHGATVQFLEAGTPPLDEWRLLASTGGAPMRLRSRAGVHDGRFSAGVHRFPPSGSGGRILVVFEGRVRIGEERFERGDILAVAAEETFQALESADLLLIEDRELSPTAGR